MRKNNISVAPFLRYKRSIVSHSQIWAVLRSDANMLHLLFTKVFDHYIFKQMQRMTFSGMLDFDRENDKLSTPYEYNLLFSAT